MPVSQTCEIVRAKGKIRHLVGKFGTKTILVISNAKQTISIGFTIVGWMDTQSFIVKSLFPEGHIFATFKQLDQSAKLFLDAWAISKVHGQSKIYCAHGISRGKSTKLCSDVSLQRKQSPSEKAKCKCPFEIRYSPQGRPKKVTPSSIPIILLKANITGCVYEHNCTMDTAKSSTCFPNQWTKHS
jgi:hypothetical protein